MKRTLGTAVLILCLCGVRLEAQERAAPVVWQGPEMERKMSNEAPFTMTVTPRDHIGMIRSVPNVQSPKKKSLEDLAVPYPISASSPVLYPPKAIRRGWEGRTVIALEILADGSVGRIAFAESSGHSILDEAARDAVKNWKFQPALKNGKPVVEFVDIPVTFQLENE